MVEKIQFPLSEAKDFLDAQHAYHDLDFRLMDLGRDLFYMYKENGFVFSNTDPRVSEYTILNDLDPDDLSKVDREKYYEIEFLVNERKKLIHRMEGHVYRQWFNGSIHLKEALEKYLEKGPIARYGSASNGDIFIFVRVVTNELIQYFERSDNKKILSGHVLTKSRRNELIKLSEALFKELDGMPDIVTSNCQSTMHESLGQFIDELKNSADSTGFAAKKYHAKLNREILIKSLSSYFFEFYEEIPVEVIVDIVAVVDSGVTERKVYEIVSKVRGFLQVQQRQRFNY